MIVRTRVDTSRITTDKARYRRERNLTGPGSALQWRHGWKGETSSRGKGEAAVRCDGSSSRTQNAMQKT